MMASMKTALFVFLHWGECSRVCPVLFAFYTMTITAICQMETHLRDIPACQMIHFHIICSLKAFIAQDLSFAQNAL